MKLVSIRLHEITDSNNYFNNFTDEQMKKIIASTYLFVVETVELMRSNSFFWTAKSLTKRKRQLINPDGKNTVYLPGFKITGRHSPFATVKRKLASVFWA